MSESQIKSLKLIIEMIEDGAYCLAIGCLQEMIEDPTGKKGDDDWNEIKSLLGLGGYDKQGSCSSFSEGSKGNRKQGKKTIGSGRNQRWRSQGKQSKRVWKIC